MFKPEISKPCRFWSLTSSTGWRLAISQQRHNRFITKTMQALDPILSDTTLITIGVLSFYTNIPHTDGIDTCKEDWDSQSVQYPPI